jgi:peptidylprolyl isomerase
MRVRTPRLDSSRLTPRRLIATVIVGAVVLTASACGTDAASESEDADTITDISLVPTTVAAIRDVPEVQVPEVIPTELIITDLIDGSGPEATEGTLVVLDYVGVRTASGEMFDNSYQRGQPFDVVLGRGMVIRGWETGLIGVQVGTRRQLDIPAELAYGDNPPGGSIIQPGDALTFLVDVRAVVSALSADDAPVDLADRAVIGGDQITLDDVVVGEGSPLIEGQTALVNVLLLRGNDREVIYNNWEFGYPDPIPVDRTQTLEALVEGLIGMRVGGTRVVSVPPALGFGEEGNEQISLPPGADLIMILVLVGSI